MPAVLEPSLPISLQLSSLYSDQGPALVSFINSHLQTCQRASCEDSTCKYFQWFLNHNKSCRSEECSSCSKLKQWISLHADSCKEPAKCPLDQLCQDMKRVQLKDSFLQRDIHVKDVLLHHANRSGSVGSTSNGNAAPQEDQNDPSPVSSINNLARQDSPDSASNGSQSDQSGFGSDIDTPFPRRSPSDGLPNRRQNGCYSFNPGCHSAQYLSSADLGRSQEKVLANLPSPFRDAQASTLFAHRESLGENIFNGPISFGRHSSVSSTASLGLRPSRVPQKISDMTNSQQRDLIKQIIQTSKGQSSDGEDAKMTNQASFGDAAVSRLDSMMSMESPSVTGLSSWSRASSIAREATPPTSAQTQGQSPKLLGKRSSNHKLERMQNVSSMDLNPFDSPPPPVHYPVQRQDTDVSRKIVQGGLGTSITLSSLPHRSDEEDAVADDTFDTEVGYPIQRASSISGPACQKLLLARISIGLDQMEHIRKVQENFMKDQKEQACKSNRSSRLSYELSEISTTPSLSPNTSGQASQLNSLEDSGTGGSPSPCHLRDPCDPCGASEVWSMNERPLSLGHASSALTMRDNGSNYQSLSSSGKSESHDHTPVSHDSTILLSGRDLSSYECSQSPQSMNTIQEHLSCCSYGDGACCHGDHSDFHGDDCGNYGSGPDSCYDSHITDSHLEPDSHLDPHIFSQFPSHSESSDTSFESHTHLVSMSDSEYSTGTSLAGSGLPSVSLPEMYKAIDDAMVAHRDDIAIMNNRQKLLSQEPPQFHPDEGIHEVWEDPVKTCDGMETLSKFPEMEMELYRQMMEPVDEERVSEEEVNRREELREYLLGQFCRKQVYREGTHWMKQTVLGKGGQATCYSILDRATNLSLALKEEMEGDKTLDEAYICLKLAHDLNVTRNIVEYFGAAMLPSFSGNLVQLFMEIMPTSMQSYLFKNGPLTMGDVHHYAFQLFDALEYLHNKESIIHCDIKPANLLLDYTAQRMKLADFGAAELLEEKKRSNDYIHGDVGAGTLAYNPPEHYSRQECSFALDIWQAGGCVLAMTTGRRPWRNLFMDPLRQHNTHYPFNKAKREYGIMIGNQHSGHMLPGFVDTTIRKLLFGCLHFDPKMRLTAMECWRLLAYTEEMSEEQRSKVTDVLGYSSSTPLILRGHALHTHPPLIDVFLGSYYEGVLVNECGHNLNPGWVGSVPYREGMTYQDLCHELNSPMFPVLQLLGPTDMTLWAGSPQELFVAANPSQCSPASLRRQLTALSDARCPVDPTKAVVLVESEAYSRPRRTNY